jgi:hypothetical protein
MTSFRRRDSAKKTKRKNGSPKLYEDVSLHDVHLRKLELKRDKRFEKYKRVDEEDFFSSKD